MSAPRCYTLAEVLEKLHLSRDAFNKLEAKHQLPCVQELLPRMGKFRRFRADLIDRYLEGTFTGPRLLARGRR